MKKRMKKRILLASSFILVFIYIFVLFYGTNYNHATEEYRMYYITRELKYYLPDGALKEYTVNRTFSYSTEGNYGNQGNGWSAVEEEGTWAVDGVSDLYFYIFALAEEYRFVCEIASDLGYDNNIYVNDALVGPINMEGLEEKASILIANNFLHEGLNKISIVSNESVAPYNEAHVSSDTRRLNTLIKSVALNEETIDRDNHIDE